METPTTEFDQSQEGVAPGRAAEVEQELAQGGRKTLKTNVSKDRYTDATITGSIMTIIIA